MAKSKAKRVKREVRVIESFAITKLPAGRRVADPSNFDYSSRSRRFNSKGKPLTTPCSSNRATCPVQLIFDNGKSYLRFCEKKRRPGRSIAVSDPVTANARAREICACWRANKRSFKKCGLEAHPLMGVPEKKRRAKRRA